MNIPEKEVQHTFNQLEGGLKNYTLEIEINERPRRGEGLNDWIRDTARVFARNFIPPDECSEWLQEQVGVDARPGEIPRQVQRSYAFESGDQTLVKMTPGGRITKVPRDDEQISNMVKQFPASMGDLKDISPIRNLEELPPLEILKQLHTPHTGGLLCLAKTADSRDYTRTFEEWETPSTGLPNSQQLRSWEMVVPNLMRLRKGIVQGSNPQREGSRTKANACDPEAMRYAVAEIDIRSDDPLCLQLGTPPVDICASFIMGIIPRHRLRMAVWSGSKSIHAWLDVHGLNATDLATLFGGWAHLGVDQHGRWPHQQFRMPNGYRLVKKQKQTVLYFNP
jgi:hypothetical protein